jgi:hypothetical protein
MPPERVELHALPALADERAFELSKLSDDADGERRPIDERVDLRAKVGQLARAEHGRDHGKRRLIGSPDADVHRLASNDRHVAGRERAKHNFMVGETRN